MQNDYGAIQIQRCAQNLFTGADSICRGAEKKSSWAESRPKGATKFCPRDITHKRGGGAEYLFIKKERLVFAIAPHAPLNYALKCSLFAIKKY